MINMDGMDQHKTSVPRPRTKCKQLESAGVPLVVKLLGAIAYGRKWYGYWCLPHWPATANVTLTGLCRVLKDVQETEGGRLPPKLHLQLDNAGRDNKNHYLVGFCGMLLQERLFEEVEVHFLPVGHTHQEIDATFSKVANKVNQYGALSVQDLMELAEGAWSGVHKDVGTDRKLQGCLDHVLDFRACLPHEGPLAVVHDFSGLGTLRTALPDGSTTKR